MSVFWNVTQLLHFEYFYFSATSIFRNYTLGASKVILLLFVHTRTIVHCKFTLFLNYFFNGDHQKYEMWWKHSFCFGLE